MTPHAAAPELDPAFGPIGRAFVFGDNIDTDLLAPGAFMKASPADLARQCLRAIAPDFATQVRLGDFLVAGENFGMGSSREQAAQSLVVLGVQAVIARSFARIFFRNAFNLGLPAIRFAEIDRIAESDVIVLDLAGGRLRNITRDWTAPIAPIPTHLREMIAGGGLLPALKKKFAASAQGTRAI